MHRNPLNRFKTAGLILLVSLLNNCTNGQGVEYNLSATEFDSKIKQNREATILDVRTPREYRESHLANAVNIDWSSRNFSNQIATLDKLKPVFVYCLSGARSLDAAAHMRSVGFTKVYELKGGLLTWRNANLAEASTNKRLPTGMTLNDFTKLTSSDKIVLVDFYADWCGPCKKMEPYLTEISNDMADQVLVIRINTDKNPDLTRELKIDAIPVLHVYKNKKLTWENTGYIGKASVIKQLK